MDASVGKQALGIGLGVARGEIVGRVREPHDVGAGIVHEPHAPHTGPVHHLEEGLRIVHQRQQEVPVLFLAGAHDGLHLGLEVAPGLDVNVNVGDARGQGYGRHGSQV
jgi:hypothetical protein